MTMRKTQEKKVARIQGMEGMKSTSCFIPFISSIQAKNLFGPDALTTWDTDLLRGNSLYSVPLW